MSDLDAIREDFESCNDPLLKKQMAFQLARQQIQIETEDVELSECLNNMHLSQYFHLMAHELDVMEPKTPEDTFQ
ncbi:hypothetical protein BC940DRAFT_331247 [Gongronella butleri]|nr:hypothetical protein BC940DRAFT_331247 [Gongronella butleri]